MATVRSMVQPPKKWRTKRMSCTTAAGGSVSTLWGHWCWGCDMTYSREGLFDSQLSRSSPLCHLSAVGSLQFCTRLGDAAFDIGHVAPSSVDSQEATASVRLCVCVVGGVDVRERRWRWERVSSITSPRCCASNCRSAQVSDNVPPPLRDSN